ncbi:MAG: septum formation initiator family protein [Clostridia bacterium]|nr:septum formation initiator family protein [Clostridia bacterium]MBQ6906414.1 septum formation initiator family protein [Clostridia bacterium]
MNTPKTNVLVKIAVLAVIVFFISSAIKLRTQLDSLIDQKQQLEIEIAELGDNIEKLNIRIETPMTVENIEKIARETLGYRDPDEIIFYNDLAD